MKQLEKLQRSIRVDLETIANRDEAFMSYGLWEFI